MFSWVRRNWLQFMAKWRNSDGLAHHPAVKVLDVSPTAHVDWGLQSLGIPALWKETEGAAVVVGIVDTGADLTHPDLAPGIIASKDFSGKGTANDGDGHGTHVAGIIGGRGLSGSPAGVAPQCSLIIAKALGDNGSGDFSSIADAVTWLTSQKVDVINMSLGGSVDDDGLHKAIIAAAKAGIIVCCAAGNDGVDAIDDVDYPGKYEEVIAVGALNPDLELAAYSSVGPEVDILAPGTQVYSTYLNNTFALLSGTSMATPFVSGCVALAIAKGRKDGRAPLDVKNMISLLKINALPRPDLLQGNKGVGIIDPADVFKTL
jgi:major intracellular serine protease